MPDKLRRYIVELDAVANVTQTVTVEAYTPDEAIEKAIGDSNNHTWEYNGLAECQGIEGSARKER